MRGLTLLLLFCLVALCLFTMANEDKSKKEVKDKPSKEVKDKTQAERLPSVVEEAHKKDKESKKSEEKGRKRRMRLPAIPLPVSSGEQLAQTAKKLKNKTDELQEFVYKSPLMQPESFVPPSMEPRQRDWTYQDWDQPLEGDDYDEGEYFHTYEPLDYQLNDDSGFDYYGENSQMDANEWQDDENVPPNFSLAKAQEANMVNQKKVVADAKGSRLASHVAAYVPKVADPLDDYTANLTKRIWENGLTKEGLSKVTTDPIYSGILKPDNLPVFMAEINQEVYNVVGKQARSRDYRYKNIQKAVASAAIPMAQIMDILSFTDEPTEDDLQDITDGATTAFTLLAGASGALNQIRRELLKPHIYQRYQGLCSRYFSVTESTPWLFGDDFADKMKAVGQSSVL